MTDLRAFLERIDAAVAGILEVREEGPQDLPGREAWMGPRYVIRGFGTPISVFRTEGIALFALARALRPEVIVEMFTGTGYSAPWLAAGAPEARVYTIDNYQEGGTHTAGWEAVGALYDRLRLPNLRCIRGDTSELGRVLDGQLADLLFCDGPAGIDYARLHAVVVRHDNPPFPDRHGFRLIGSSHFAVHCPEPYMARLAREVEEAILAVQEVPAAVRLTEAFA